jgi:hypothetical protein
MIEIDLDASNGHVGKKPKDKGATHQAGAADSPLEESNESILESIAGDRSSSR